MFFVLQITNDMKNLVSLLGFFIFAASFLNAQNIGINKTSPLYPVDIVQPTGIMLLDFQPVVNVLYTGTNNQDAVAIQGVSQPMIGKGIGGVFSGGNLGGAFFGHHAGIYSIGYGLDDNISYGISSDAVQDGAENTTLVGTKGYATGTSSTNFGARGEAFGANSTNYGVHGFANGTGSANYGLYGTAANGTTNWAGYFNQGNVYINNKLGIGHSDPFFPLEILSNQAVARLESTAGLNGSVIDLKNTTGGSTYLGSLNFSSAGITPGQISYLTNNSLLIRVNSTERMRFASDGMLGIGQSNPLHPVHINQPTGVTLTDLQPVMKVQYTGSNNNDAVAIQGFSNPAAGKGLGCLFTGGNTGGVFHGGHTGTYSAGYGVNSGIAYGVNADAIQNGASSTTLVGTKGYATGTSSTNYGAKGEAFGTNSTNIGVHGFANGTSSTNYGVYGTATSGTQNWAGYFNEGNVYINNNLGIGQINPTVDLDILSPQAVARMITSNHLNGSVITLQNNTVSPSYLGAINFSDGGTTPGQIAYQGDNNLTIRVNNVERIRINSSGLVGIGRTPTTNKLEVDGTASKSSAGDWVANSDARLKKNISPLDPEQMIDKLLTLKGVTYEWNDDKTGTERPEGIQYGFTAQNISEAFPSLVEEDAKGYLQTAYGTYDAMMVEALRYLYTENKQLKNELEEIKGLIKEMAGK